MRHFSSSVFLLAFIVSHLSVRASDNPVFELPAEMRILIDASVAPCKNFYQYACGAWIQKAEIPEDLPFWDRSFVRLRQDTLMRERTLLEALISRAPDETQAVDGERQLLGDYYQACTDAPTIAATSIGRLRHALAPIEALERHPDPQRFARLLAELLQHGASPWIDFGAQPDFKQSQNMIGALDQGNLGLPDRDYYLEQTPQMKSIRRLYLRFIGEVLRGLGVHQIEAQQQATRIWELEKRVARTHQTMLERRDPQNLDHPMRTADLGQIAPHFDWGSFFGALDQSQLARLNVASPQTLKQLDGLLPVALRWKRQSSTQRAQHPASLADFVLLLRWRLIQEALPLMPEEWVNMRFRFVATALTGQKEAEPSWKRCLRLTERHLGFALGRAYLKRHVAPQLKEHTESMVRAIEMAFARRLEELGWMDDSTRERARQKLNTMINQIAYPKHARTYADLQINPQSALENSWAGEASELRFQLAKIGKPRDRAEWEIIPQAVNAYYDLFSNKMVFPAGIFQEPFYRLEREPAVNYGAMGAIIGHELTHGFDDVGRGVDERGNLANWWSASALEQFRSRAQCLVRQYDHYEVLPGLRLNGSLTLGENIADQGGLGLAYRAWSESLQGERTLPPAVRSQSERRFFLSYAQIWCAKQREAYVRTLVKTDAHSSPESRVNGTLSQFRPFARAFECTAGLPMAPETTCEVW